MTTIRIAPGTADEVALDNAEIIDLEARKAHTGMGVLRASAATNTDLLPLAQSERRLDVELDGTVEWRGFLTQVDRTRQSGRTSLKALGVAKRLEETAPDYQSLPNESVRVRNVSLPDAIDNYWTRTPFDNVSVTFPTLRNIAENEPLQVAETTSEWTSVLNVDAQTPVYVENDRLKLAQTGFFFEAEDNSGAFTTIDQGSYAGNGNLSGGEGARLEIANDAVSADFALNYEIPAEEFRAEWRIYVNNADMEVEARLDGSVIDSRSYNGVTDDIKWRLPNNLNQSPISEGSHTIELVVTNHTSGTLEVDCFAVVDLRFDKTFDNIVDTDPADPADFHLDGPELYDAVDVEFSEAEARFNIDVTRIDVEEVTGRTVEEVAVSTDDGATFTTDTGTNDSSLATSPTLDVIARIRLGPYTEDSTTSPAVDDAGHELDRLRVLGDLNDLPVVDDLELTDDHFSNLQTLHDRANFQFTIEHGDGPLADLPVTSYQEGDEVRSAPPEYDAPVERRTEVDATEYANVVAVRGRESGGSRPFGVREDAGEITDVGRRIRLTLTDPRVTTQAGAEFVAISVLDDLVDQNRREGTIAIPARTPIFEPGFARPVDFGGGTVDRTIESVVLRHSGDELLQEHEFTPPDDVAGRIARLERDQRALDSSL
jgi:hypothetical protein